MKAFFRVVVQISVYILPWRVRRRILMAAFGFKLSPSSFIGLSVILAKDVRLERGAYIGHLNFVNSIDGLRMGDFSKIGRSNWITGASSGANSFRHDSREAFLQLKDHARVTGMHHIDCTGGVSIGAFSTVAGVRSQILTHEIDIVNNKQRFGSVEIGDYCFVGTGCIILMDAVLPDRSVLAGGAVLAAKYKEKYQLYGGVPAKSIKPLPHDAAYFHRKHGNVR